MPYRNPEDKKAWKERNRAKTRLYGKRYYQRNKPEPKPRPEPKPKAEKPPRIKLTEEQLREKERQRSRDKHRRLSRTSANLEKKRLRNKKDLARRKLNPVWIEKERQRKREYKRVRDAQRKNDPIRIAQRADKKLNGLIYRKLAARLRGRICSALRGKNVHKRTRTQKLTGCSWAQLKAHLESLMHPLMSWENYGWAWHIDHIIPCCTFNLALEKEQRRCFHYSNLRPLWAKKNFARPKREVFQPDNYASIRKALMVRCRKV